MSEKPGLLLFDTVIPDLKATSVKQAYQTIARTAGESISYPPASLYEKMMAQERKATSGIGCGVALPHLRLKRLDSPYMLFARLTNLVDFNAIDDQPVSLVCLLLSPDHDVARHLRRLSRLTRLFREEALCRQLREARSEDAIQALLLASRQKLLAA